jgi:DNA-binding NarL/FixJ family response regulator
MNAPRLLLVDDQRDVTRLLRSALGHELEIVELPSGEEALLETRRGRVDLLVVGFRLPGMSGLELIEKVRVHHPGLKSILIAGKIKDEFPKNALRVGVEALFSKPVPLADFLNVVERSLSLDRTILPQDDAGGSETGRPDLNDLLAKFCEELEARAVLLLSDHGRVLARVGDLLDSSTEVSLLSAMMAIYNAGQRVSHLVRQEMPQSFHFFPGRGQDMILIPLDATHAMLVTGEKSAAHELMLRVLDKLGLLQREFEEVFYSVSKEPQTGVSEVQEAPGSPVESGEAGEESAPEKLDRLLGETKQLKPEEADAFWQKAVENQGSASGDSDVLSYEQARSLGLTPNEDNG